MNNQTIPQTQSKEKIEFWKDAGFPTLCRWAKATGNLPMLDEDDDSDEYWERQQQIDNQYEEQLEAYSER